MFFCLQAPKKFQFFGHLIIVALPSKKFNCIPTISCPESYHYQQIHYSFYSSCTLHSKQELRISRSVPLSLSLDWIQNSIGINESNISMKICTMEGNNLHYLVISLILKVDIGQPREIPKNQAVDLKDTRYEGWRLLLKAVGQFTCNAQLSTKSCHSQVRKYVLRTSFFIQLHSIPYITIM